MTQEVEREPASPSQSACRSLMMFAEAFRLAISAQSLLLALIGVLLVSWGWQLSGMLFLPDANQRRSDDAAAVEFHRHASRWPGGRGPIEGVARFLTQLLPQTGANKFRPEEGQSAARVAQPIDPVVGVPYRMVEPFRAVASVQNSWRSLAYFLTGGACCLAVWALLGGAITRATVVWLGLQQRVGLSEALQFARRKWTALFTAPALPLVGNYMIALPLLVLGWILRLDIGVLLAGLLWIPVLLISLLMALLALGLLFGWPLMWGTIATEDSDAFDAISRSYAYTFQKPLHYLFYALIAATLGLAGWLVAWLFSELVIGLAYWGVSWGSGTARLDQLPLAVNTSVPRDQLGALVGVGAWLIDLSVGLVRATASAFSFAYFWCATGTAYLLLRRDTDQTELDEVVVGERHDEFDFGLPPLDKDEAGVPGVSPEEVGGPA